MKSSLRSFLQSDFLAIWISLVVFALTAMIGWNIFENLPHIEDEVAYIWQANVIARENLTLPSPACPNCFLVPFVVDYNGLRFGKYPLGWPVVLSFAVRSGARAWLPPLLAGINIALAYQLLKKILDKKTVLLAIFLIAISPFFLMNASSLLAHSWSLFLTLTFALGWMDTFVENSSVPKLLSAGVAAFSLGVLALTRPMSALGVALPFLLHGIFVLFSRDSRARRFVLLIGLCAGLIASLHFIWQYAVTGNPWLNPYELWWPYDKIGFGPNVGLQENGYSLRAAYANTNFNLWVGSHDVFGWPFLSYIFIPFGILALFRNLKAWLVGLIFPSLVFVYSFYWIGAWLFGPRYYYEGLIGLAMLTAAGIRLLAGKIGCIPIHLPPRFQSVRFFLITSVIAILIAGNLVYYLPIRLTSLYGLYGHKRSRLDPFQTLSAQQLTPALVIVHMQHDWVEYGTLLELSSPYNDTPFIFTFSRGEELDQQVAALFPGRNLFHYYADVPFKFFTAPRPSSDF
ncbi:MAG: hypothetical protein IT308_08610 [Anaerolineaceae bacterium]|nr:hypothetical protein [Anaerolineaceae bacterium]